MSVTRPIYKNLVFSGGGASGIAYAGAIDELAKTPEFSLDRIERVAGTSIGAIAALMISLKYSSAEVLSTLLTIDLKSLADGGSPPSEAAHLLSGYGIYKGKALYELILRLIKIKIPDVDPETITFNELKKRGCKDLYVVATKLFKLNDKPTGKRKVFSWEDTPDTPIAAAIHASAAAPLYFERVRLKKEAKGRYVLSEDGDLYTDGGVSNNYPIDLFDKSKFIANFPGNIQEDIRVINQETIGLAMSSTDQIIDEWHKPVKTPIKDGHLFDYAEALINNLLMRLELDGLDKVKFRNRTIEVDRLGVSLGAFNMTEKTKMALEESGRQAVRHYFAALRSQPTITPTIAAAAAYATQKVPNGSLWQGQKVASKPVAEEKKNVVQVARAGV